MMSVIGLFLIAAMVSLATGNGNWFFIIMIGSIPVFWVLDKFASPDRKRREKQAANRLFGIPDEDS